MSTFSDRLKAVPMNIHDVHEKVVIVRVPDPRTYSAGDYLTRLLRRAGAHAVIIARPEDKIELLGDAELAQLGLVRRPQPVA